MNFNQLNNHHCLELILKKLDFLNLINLTRVNKFFKNIISNNFSTKYLNILNFNSSMICSNYVFKNYNFLKKIIYLNIQNSIINIKFLNEFENLKSIEFNDRNYIIENNYNSIINSFKNIYFKKRCNLILNLAITIGEIIIIKYNENKSNKLFVNGSHDTIEIQLNDEELGDLFDNIELIEIYLDLDA